MALVRTAGLHDLGERLLERLRQRRVPRAGHGPVAWDGTVRGGARSRAPARVPARRRAVPGFSGSGRGVADDQGLRRRRRRCDVLRGLPGRERSPVRDHRGCESYYAKHYTLGWDLDANGSFESDGDSIGFSAATLDGPTTRTVNARAKHPVDTSLVGTGATVSLPVQVRNVPPQVASASVRDSLGHDLDGGATPAIVGLPVTVAATFDDPGVADTQTATIDWGDGSPLDTSFTSFSDAYGAAIGVIKDNHAFLTPGTRVITLTLTDDDGGATTRTFTVKVLSLVDAIKGVADTLTQLIQSATDPRVASALRAARDDLIGNHGGSPPMNGATDKLDADAPSAAITKLKAAISELITAESRGAGDLTSLKDLLGLVAEGIATASYEEAKAATPSPNPGQAKTLQRSRELIASGHGQLVAKQYLTRATASAPRQIRRPVSADAVAAATTASGAPLRGAPLSFILTSNYRR